MNIQKLYDKYVELYNDNKEVFENSGMTHNIKKLGFGFFPFGTGILNAEIEREKEEIKPGGILVLGNDFGTVEYLEKKCDEDREWSKNSSTIRNLLPKLNDLGIGMERVFCTNLYLGVRLDGSNDQRMKLPKIDYRILCYQFFIEQMKAVKPKLVICLGNAVRIGLIEHSSFFDLDWDLPNFKFTDLLNDSRYLIRNVEFIDGQNTSFLLLPHPSRHSNFSGENVETPLKNLKKELEKILNE